MEVIYTKPPSLVVHSEINKRHMEGIKIFYFKHVRSLHHRAIECNFYFILFSTVYYTNRYIYFTVCILYELTTQLNSGQPQTERQSNIA